MSRKSAKSKPKNKAKRPVKSSLFSGQAEKIILLLMLAVIALLVFVGPFQRGLFFPRELLQAQVLVFGLLILWGAFRVASKDSRLFETPLDICLLVLFAAYFVSFFVAVHKRDALEELLKIGVYLVVYLVALDISRHWPFRFGKKLQQDAEAETGSALPPGLNMLLHLLLAAAAVITVASLGVPAGHWDFVGAYASNRIASPMGYANTAAAYLMAAYLLALALAPLAARRYRALYLAPAALMLLTVVLTFSRGAWLLLPPLALLLIIASAPGHRLRSFLYLAATGLVAVPAALLVDPIFRSDLPARAWWLIIASVAAAVVLGMLVELYFTRSRRQQTWIAASGLSVVVLTLIVTVIAPVMGPLHLERPAGAGAGTESFQQVIDDVETGQVYRLALEVNAAEELSPGAEPPDYVWRVRVLGGLPGYRDEELVDYRGGATDGWQEQVFTFETGEETTRLDIRLYNRYPGTSFTARSVRLSSPEEEYRLSFALSRILPDRFYDRIFSYSLDRNLDRRLELFADAGKVIRDYPILGAGGGAWAAVYKAYQDQPYDSREVHNHYLQVWVEAGIFGFLAFIGIWVSFAAAFIRNCMKQKASPEMWQYWTATFLPVAALGAHSIIDWNFSLAAVGIFLFVLLGAGRSLDRAPWFKRPGRADSKPGTGLIIGLVGLTAGVFLFIYSLVLLNGLDATWHSQELMNRGNLKQAVIEKERAIRLDPFRAENYHNLSVLTEQQAQRTGIQADIEKVFHWAEMAYEMEPFNPNYFLRYGDLLMTYVDVDEGLSYIDRLIEVRPHAESSYVRPALSRMQLAEYLIDIGNRPAADRYIEEIMALEQEMQEQQGDSAALAYIMGRTYILLGNPDEAERYFEAVKESDHFYGDARRMLAELRGEDEGNGEGEEPDEESEQD